MSSAEARPRSFSKATLTLVMRWSSVSSAIAIGDRSNMARNSRSESATKVCTRACSIASAAWSANCSSSRQLAASGSRPPGGSSTLSTPMSVPSGAYSGANSESSGCQAPGSSTGAVGGVQLGIGPTELWSLL
jgi:hypothetical protein